MLPRERTAMLRQKMEKRLPPSHADPKRGYEADQERAGLWSK
jgi:hypothetical protein